MQKELNNNSRKTKQQLKKTQKHQKNKTITQEEVSNNIRQVEQQPEKSLVTMQEEQ